jgi:NRAMP (natural resistance-associated macrophage protein)-like metal ion transporter
LQGVTLAASEKTRRRPRRGTPSIIRPSKPRLWRILGPGLITGAADDDPSGIATYAQAGTQFGFRLGWTMLLTFPLMVTVQAISARIGRTTGRGIAGNLREHYPAWLLYSIVSVLFIANTLNIGADLGAMAEASRLLAPAVPGWAYIITFGVVCTLAQVFLKHTRYVAVLKWLTFSLLAYLAALCVIDVRWLQVMKGLVWPGVSFERDLWLTVVAILGTTISPYLFFWQAGQEVEDTKAKPRREPLRKDPAQGVNALARIRLDTIVGMALSNLIALSIMITAGATLHGSGTQQLTSAAQAAEALRPIAGPAAFALFALGIIGTGLLAVPVLAGSAGYAWGEARRWPVGLARRPLEAKAFYCTIALSTLLGAAANILELNPIRALVWVAVLNGVAAVPVMCVLMLMSARQDIMGGFSITPGWKLLGWIATAVMAVAAIILVVSPFVQ